MRVIFLLGVALLAAVSGQPLEDAAEEVLPLFNYHENIGIPLAEKIRQAEEAIHQDKARGLSDRVVGGAVVNIQTYPYLGGLLLNMLQTAGRSVCGSSLLTLNRLITAAHCWFDGNNQAWQVEVVLGSQFLFSGGTRVVSQRVVVHPQWTPSNFANDVAIIYLPTNIIFNQNIQPVSLPFGNLLVENFSGWWSRAAGYGKIADNLDLTTATQVSHVSLQVINFNLCLQSFGSTFIRDSTICTSGVGGVGVCRGDSGGPLVVTQNGQDILVGVSSFVAAAGCQLGHPSAYARVTSFSNFILQNMW